jgi:hypothetical protein
MKMKELNILAAMKTTFASRWRLDEVGGSDCDWRMMPMEESVFSQVSPFIRLSVSYIVSRFQVAERAATELVQSVLLSFLSKRGQKLSNPKRYLLRACRWKALQTFRRGVGTVGVRPGEEHPEILVSLDEKDRERFFGPAVPSEREHSEAPRPGRDAMDLSATVEVPGSAIRVSFCLTKPVNKAS